MQNVLAQKKYIKDDEDSGDEASVGLPPVKTPNKRQITQGDTLEKNMLKMPAATRQSGSPSSLEFPGTDSRHPLMYGNSKVCLPLRQVQVAATDAGQVCCKIKLQVKGRQRGLEGG